jgi:hypothetical protein
MAADQGETDSQHFLGFAYEKGEGVPQDYAEAYKWFILECSYSSMPTLPSPGKTALDSLKTKMSPQQIADGMSRSYEWLQAKTNNLNK